MGKSKGFSPRTKDATDGGGIDGSTAVISEIGVVEEFNYGGRSQGTGTQAALRVVYKIEGMERPWEDHYSFGKSERFEAIDDSYGIRSTTDAEGLNRKSAAYFFNQAIEEAAEASELDIDDLIAIEDDGFTYRALEGRTVVLKNKPYTNVSGDTKDKPVPAKFVESAAGSKKSRPTNGANGKSTKTTSRSSPDDVEAKTIAAIEELIEEHTSVKVNDLPNLVFEAHRKDPDAKAMMQWAFKASNLADEDRPWSFDKKKGLLRASD